MMTMMIHWETMMTLTTPPITTNKGVELIAVCKTRTVRSKLSRSSGDVFVQEAGREKTASAAEKRYLEELRKRAVIKER